MPSHQKANPEKAFMNKLKVTVSRPSKSKASAAPPTGTGYLTYFQINGSNSVVVSSVDSTNGNKVNPKKGMEGELMELSAQTSQALPNPAPQLPPASIHPEPAPTVSIEPVPIPALLTAPLLQEPTLPVETPVEPSTWAFLDRMRQNRILVECEGRAEKILQSLKQKSKSLVENTLQAPALLYSRVSSVLDKPSIPSIFSTVSPPNLASSLYSTVLETPKFASSLYTQAWEQTTNFYTTALEQTPKLASKFSWVTADNISLNGP